MNRVFLFQSNSTNGHDYHLFLKYVSEGGSYYITDGSGGFKILINM